jgi:hypothetical protein
MEKPTKGKEQRKRSIKRSRLNVNINTAQEFSEISSVSKKSNSE